MRAFLVVILSFLSLPAVAQDLVLTWEECVRMTRENNKELAAQIANLEATKLREEAARSSFFPEVSADLGYGRVNLLTPQSGDTQSYSANLNVRQNLFAGFGDDSRLRQARANTATIENDLRLLKARLSNDLKTSFENLLFAQRSIELRKSIVKRREDNVRLVELRFRGGRENRGSVLLSQASLGEARFEQNQANIWIKTYSATLAKVLGLTEPGNIEVRGSIPTNNPPSPNSKLLKIAEETPEVKKSIAAEEWARNAVGISQANFYPTLNLSAGVNNADNQFFPSERRQWTVGLVLSVPLFNGGRDYFASQAETKSLLSASLKREQSLRVVLENLELRRGDFLQAVERVSVNEAYVNAAQVRSEIGRMRYNNGLISFEDWSIIENDLIDKQKKVLESRRDRVIFESNWENVQGKGVFE